MSCKIRYKSNTTYIEMIGTEHKHKLAPSAALILHLRGNQFYYLGTQQNIRWI